MTPHDSSSPRERSLFKRFLRWAFLICGAVALFITGYELVLRLAFHEIHLMQSRTELVVFTLMHVLVAALFLALIVSIVRRLVGRFKWMTHVRKVLFTRRTAQRALVGFACFATLVALFYTEENWRGKRAWEKCKAELEAKGAVLDWSAYIPPPVPDDQNFFKAPGISETNWMGRGARELSERMKGLWQGQTNSIVMAELTIASPQSTANAKSGGTILRVDDPRAQAEMVQQIRAIVGPTTPSTVGSYSLAARSLDKDRPAAIKILSEKTPTDQELVRLLPATFEGSIVKIKSVGNGSFQVLLEPSFVTADEFLRRSDPCEADFDVVRNALKRPYTQMDGDYSYPSVVPIPNFITMRSIAQILAERTKCYLLVGQPDKALRDLTLLHDICRITEAKPTGKPMTLLASMINVAITGLFANTIADGLRLHAWREPQLIAIQDQLARVKLPLLVDESFHEERVFAAQTMEHMSRSGLAKILANGSASLSARLTDPMYLFIMLAPRGWFYQNMVVHTEGMEQILGTLDSKNDIILPQITANARLAGQGVRMSPYSFLSRNLLPNFTRAWMQVAHNQTFANEAFVACALERYRLAHSEYPESLDALVPQFADKLPHDIIGGQPLKYRRTNDGSFLLYSIGWNEKDDGGQGAKQQENGDWVWGAIE